MAKRALLDVLEQTIGKYVHNLDAESLNLALWSGKIQLNNLELNIDNVNAELDRQAAEAPNLAVPFRVIAGEFENFSVNVPWAHLMSQSVVLRAKGLSITVEPYDRTAQADFLHSVVESESIRAQKIRQHRLKSIQNADDYRKNANAIRKLAEEDLQDSTSSSDKSTFSSRLVRRIIENVQVEIEDVKIILQDADSNAGVQLDSFKLVTTNAQGTQTFVDRTVKNADNTFLYKQLKIDGFGIYLDENKDKAHKLTSIGEEEGDMQAYHAYLLSPLSFEANLRQADATKCIEFPKYRLESELPGVAVSLSKTQLDLAKSIAAKLQPSESASRPLFPEYRPLQRPTKGSTKVWWKYATRCIGRLNGRRSWVEFYHAFQNRKTYIPLYKRKAHSNQCTWISPLNETEQVVLERIEADRSISIEGLMTWRNIADAQVEKEMEKHNMSRKKTSVFSSLFGSSTTKEEEDVPIQLSKEELTELEAMTMEQIADSEVSKDSKLCDLDFKLGMFRVKLLTREERSLAELHMGTASTKLHANADGSFEFDFSLSSLEISDDATPKTLFPKILRNLHERGEKEAAFDLHLSKTRTGDQELRATLCTFEAVASPMLYTEVVNFISEDKQGRVLTTRSNPLLAQSLSGSVDLFYDASEGQSSARRHSDEKPVEPIVSKEFTEKMIDVWKAKTKSRSQFRVSLDIQAPIFVVPESCVDGKSQTLILDFGRLQMQYGLKSPPVKVSKWFEENRLQLRQSESILDSGNLTFSDLKLSVGILDDYKSVYKNVRFRSDMDAPAHKAIIEPISLSLDLGIESNTELSVPRIAFFGMIPGILISMSPTDVSRATAVARAWSSLVKDSSESHEIQEEDNRSAASSISQGMLILDRAKEGGAALAYLLKDVGSQNIKLFYADVRLGRCSIQVATEDGEGMEAHLVSVRASSTTLSDGTIDANLMMGWFWVLDRFRNDFTRRQRLLAHSKLPRDPDEYAEGHRYDIVKDLERIGVFADDYDGSENLASLTLKLAPGSSFGKEDPISSSALETSSSLDVKAILEASFSSLHLFWNPRAMKVALSMFSKFFAFLDDSILKQEASPVIVAGGTHLLREKDVEPDKSRESKGESGFVLRATLAELSISLNSAVDDLPLFMISMQNSKALLAVAGKEANVRANLALGNFSIITSPLGETLREYRQVLGLKSLEEKSLLVIDYWQGTGGVEKSPFGDKEVKGLEAAANVKLAPLKITFLQAHILALVEYTSEGILGSLTNQAASTAAAAVADLASAEGGSRIFQIHGNDLEVTVPQSAVSHESVGLCIGSLKAEYTSGSNGGHGDFEMSRVELTDYTGESLLNNPFSMKLAVDVAGEQNQSDGIKVDCKLTKAHFLVQRYQYKLLLAVVAENLGEKWLYLRDERDSAAEEYRKDVGDDPEDGIRKQAEISHAGIVQIDSQTMIVAMVTIEDLSMSLYGEDADDPLVSITAQATSLSYISNPVEQQSNIHIGLRSLECRDDRIVSIARQFRTIVSSRAQGDTGSADDGDFFSIEYCTLKENRSLAVTVGSPTFTFVPDVLQQLLKFVASDQIASDDENPDKLNSPAPLTRNEVPVIQASTEGEGFKAIESPNADQGSSSPIPSFEYTFATGLCQIVLVDLGSDYVRTSMNAKLRRSTGTISTAECIVVTGVFDVKVGGEESVSKNISSISSEFHCDRFQVFSAQGHQMESPLQILDPTKLSAYISTSTTSSGETTIDLRLATIQPIDLCCSMRNVALVYSILSSLSDSLSYNESSQIEEEFLTEEQELEIENLAVALDTSTSRENEVDMSVSEDSSSMAMMKADLSRDSSEGTSSTLSVKVTVPSAQFTVVNDLQGSDDALLRVQFQNLVMGGQSRSGYKPSKHSLEFTSVDVNLHCSIISDYFESSENRWSALLVKPWEVNLRSSRGISTRYEATRPSTTIEIEAFPCHLSFSEHFLTNIASAKQMWSVYASALESSLQSTPQDLAKASFRKSIASSAARTFITALPFAIENRTGFEIEYSLEGDSYKRFCSSGFIDYFTFHPPRLDGARGGKRQYGQDVSLKRAVTVHLNGIELAGIDLDLLLGTGRQVRNIGGNLFVVISVVQEGRVRMLRVSSGVNVQNNTCIPFSISIIDGSGVSTVGECRGFRDAESSKSRDVSLADGFSKPTRRLGLPSLSLESLYTAVLMEGRAKLSVVVKPIGIGKDMDAVIATHVSTGTRQTRTETSEITCRHESEVSGSDTGPFVFQAAVRTMWVDGYPLIDIFLEPRAVIENDMPISIMIRSPMPFIYGHSSSEKVPGDIHTVQSGASLEIFTSGPSIAVSVACADKPVGGSATDWMEGLWVDLPLMPEFRLLDPLEGCLPFVHRASDPLSRPLSGGMTFYIVEGEDGLAQLSGEKKHAKGQSAEGVGVSPPSKYDSNSRTFYVTTLHVLVDHSGDLLFEQYHDRKGGYKASHSFSGFPSTTTSSESLSVPLGSYSSEKHIGRITPLSATTVPLQLMHLNMRGDEGLQRSSPFRIEDISICDGGVESTQLRWVDGSISGFCAYRKLINGYSSEIHVVPEYIIYNGSSKHELQMKTSEESLVVVPRQKFVPIYRYRSDAVVISLEYRGLRCRTAPVRVDQLGLRIVLLKALDGRARGTVAVQTVTGSYDSRLVVKVGEVRLGGDAAVLSKESSVLDFLKNDYLRFRIQWSELKLTLLEAKAPKRLEDLQLSVAEKSGFESSRANYGPLCAFLLHRFTIDWQRVFKQANTGQSRSRALVSNERSQLSIIVHNIQLQDLSPDALHPIVFDSSSDVSFFDLCIRTRGPIDASLIQIDLIDLNLACSKRGPEKIIASTSEAFVWKLIDTGERILAAAVDFAGVNIELKWDAENEEYQVSIKQNSAETIDSHGNYTPPSSSTLYDVKKLRVSPFAIVASFVRSPEKSRYKVVRGSAGANIMNYFTRRLKFTIKDAKLSFPRFEQEGIKGPLDRVVEILGTVYMTRTKLMFVKIMAAASFQDWKYLAARDDGDDEYVEGDILRVTGNMAGNSVNYVFSKAGKGLGSGLSSITSKFGEGIENATDKIGARPIGAGLNSVVSGVGDGFGSTVSGVGSGAGKVLKGAGQGVGQVFGGVAGGAMMIGKGIGKGITEGDGRAVASGIAQGLTSAGTGVGRGVESVVTGTAEGVFAAGSGLFSGVRSIGRGIGNAVTACFHCCGCCAGNEERDGNNLLATPLLQRDPTGDDAE